MLLYISTDLGINSSGGTVVNHELNALKSMGKVFEIGFERTHPLYYNLPDVPFLIDYFTLKWLRAIDLSEITLAHFYGGCYTESIKYLRSKGIKTSYTIMWHDRKISIQEHDKIYGSGTYPYIYVKDDTLFNLFCGGIREADCVIAAGSVPRNNMLKEGAKRVEIVPMGCYMPDKVAPLPEQFNAGYLGAVGPDKGLMYLIQAWDSLHYIDNSTLIFAGRQIAGFMERFIHRYAARGKYHVVGAVGDPRELYDRCSVYVQPSAIEGFGMEVPEAMSYGRPVIVTNGAGAADCITNGVDGFIVPKMNAQAIADKIDWFKNHPKELAEMGRNAQENAKNYTWEKTEEKYVKLWRELLGS
jgi:glycosyltransferase involved in cell wall biosynthesis